MFKYILKRLLMLIPIIIGISFLIYFVMSLSPGDPARIILGEYATQEDVDALREEMGLNDSLIVQYSRYIFNAVKGDLGTSYQTGQPVMGEILDHFPYTLKLAVGAVLIAVVLGIPIGIISAVKQYSWIDNLSMVVSMVLTSMPGFWYGLMLMIIFSQAALVPINRSIIFYALRVAVHHSFLQYICIDDSNDPFYDA